MKPLYLSIALMVALAAVPLATAPALAGKHNFLAAPFRIDQAAVNSSTGYRYWVAGAEAEDVPGDSFVTAWLSVDFDDQPGDDKFTQVGLISDDEGLKWFVYSLVDIDCLEGDTEWEGKGCEGDLGHIVAENTFHKVEMVSYPPVHPEWLIRIYNSGGSGTTVARVNHTSTGIYDAGAVFEEAWESGADPDIEGDFTHWRPQYKSTSGSWTNWPATSGSNRNHLYDAKIGSHPDACPDDWAASHNVGGDNRKWYTGTPDDDDVTYYCIISPLF